MIDVKCAASIPLPGGRFGRCPDEASRPYRSMMFCEKHIEMAERTEARHHPAYVIFRAIMDEPDPLLRCPRCLAPEHACRCSFAPDGLA